MSRDDDNIAAGGYLQMDDDTPDGGAVFNGVRCCRPFAVGTRVAGNERIPIHTWQADRAPGD
jgi:hypothetical protein